MLKMLVGHLVFGLTTCKAALAVFLVTCVCACAATAAEVADEEVHRAPAASHASVSHVPPPVEDQTPGIPQSEPVLSPQAEQVSQIAARNGVKDFLLVDKPHGEIVLFENGKPSFSGPALTGESMGDRVPPKVLTLRASAALTTDQKVTPAGQFTVRPELDPEYGRVWTIREIHGKDWDFAIHRVYLGTPSEHRDVRLRSPDALDRHITYGCINVDRSTIQLFTRKLPRKAAVPLYILPWDEAMIETLFPVRGSAPEQSSR